MTAHRLTASDVSAYLESIDLTPPVKDVAVDSYENAAAVLAAIRDLKSLRSLDGSIGGAERLLGPNLVPAQAQRLLGGDKMLRHEVRRRALKRLGNPTAILAALEANPHERNGPVQQRFEEFLRGQAPPLAEQSVDSLECALQAVLWLEDLKLQGVPSPDDIRAVLSLARFRQPFERLAGEHFRGRVKELDRLRRFVGVLAPETRQQQVSQQVDSILSRLLSFERAPALNIYGLGGIGKSALIMRFLLEHMKLTNDQRIPFAYLDFDNPLISINRLSTMAAEIVRQLRMQFAFVTLRTLPDDAVEVSRILINLLQDVAIGAKQPFLLVLDTFEEVQYRGEAAAVPLWDMLDEIQAQRPFLRVLISGRAPVTSLTLAGKKPEQWELKGVDDSAAQAILEARGVLPDLAKSLVKQVGAVPLSLRLAAEVVRREGGSSRGVRDLRTSNYIFFSVSDAVIQGQLYDRILDHIHSAEVKKLAHPGLVLRTITADLILKVLKEPCGLSISTFTEAEALYTELARETALVSEETANTLSYRTDLRRTMLKLLQDRDPEKAKDIHRRAVAYYADQEQLGAVAEQLYHRLMLDERPENRDRELHRNDVRESLSRSLSELPVGAQTFLSAKGFEISPEILSEFTREQHQEYVAAKIEEYLPHGPTGASRGLQLLLGVEYRGANSPLYVAEAHARFVQQKYDDVLKLTDEGLRLAFEAQDWSRVLNLLGVKAWSLERIQQDEELAKALPYLKQYSQQLNRPLFALQWASQSLRLNLRRTPSADVSAEAATIAGSMEKLRDQDPRLVAPIVAGALGPIAPLQPRGVLDVVTSLANVGMLPQAEYRFGFPSSLDDDLAAVTKIGRDADTVLIKLPNQSFFAANRAT